MFIFLEVTKISRFHSIQEECIQEGDSRVNEAELSVSRATQLEGQVRGKQIAEEPGKNRTGAVPYRLSR